MKTTSVAIGYAALVLATLAPSAICQTPVSSQSAQDAAIAISGTAVSSSRNTLTVRTETGLYMVFVFDRYTVKPATIPAGTAVKVISTPTGEEGVRLASDVIVAPPAGSPPPKAPSTPSTGSAQRSSPEPYETGEAVPVSVRKLEGSIERQSRKYSVGFRTGVGLDPELMLVGIQARVGPFFNGNFSFRPNLDFGFGEVTKLFALDLNGVYRIPFNTRQSRWSAFVGAGPCLSFIHRNFERAAAGDNGIDFGEFDYQTGLNILTGVEFRSGFFMEAKTTVWSGPHLRLSIGYSF